MHGQRLGDRHQRGLRAAGAVQGAREQAQRDREAIVMCAQHEALPRHHLLGHSRRLVELPEPVQDVGGVVLGGERVRMIQTEVAFTPGSHWLDQRRGFRETPGLGVRDRQAFANRGGVARIVAGGRDVDGERLFLVRLGAGQIAAIAHDAGDVPQQLRYFGTSLAPLLALDLQRAGIHRRGFVVAALFVEGVGDLALQSGDGQAARPVAPPPSIEIRAQQGGHAVVFAERLIGVGHHARHLRLHVGLTAKLGVDSPRTRVQQIAHGRFAPLHELGVRRREERLEEVLHRVGLARLALGPASLPGRRHQSADERQQQQRRGAGAHAVPPEELPGAIRECVAARRDREPLEVPPHVGRERFGRRIPALGRLLQRLEDNPIEIAPQPSSKVAGTDAGAGRHWRLIENRALELAYGPAAHPVRPFSGQQLVQQHTEGVDIRRRVDRFAAQLLRRRVVEREGAHEAV